MFSVGVNCFGRFLIHFLHSCILLLLLLLLLLCNLKVAFANEGIRTFTQFHHSISRNYVFDIILMTNGQLHFGLGCFGFCIVIIIFRGVTLTFVGGFAEILAGAHVDVARTEATHNSEVAIPSQPPSRTPLLLQITIDAMDILRAIVQNFLQIVIVLALVRSKRTFLAPYDGEADFVCLSNFGIAGSFLVLASSGFFVVSPVVAVAIVGRYGGDGVDGFFGSQDGRTLGQDEFRFDFHREVICLVAVAVVPAGA
mmetsp:Transcript_4816/g.9960  ORF Transcript_4816/g.9960 Transcript_4816/m.9960 type:complete len:254 (+) Transcript_4816:733-1494(+)